MILENITIGEEYLHAGQFVKVVEIDRNAGYAVVTYRTGEVMRVVASELRQKPARMG